MTTINFRNLPITLVVINLGLTLFASPAEALDWDRVVERAEQCTKGGTCTSKCKEGRQYFRGACVPKCAHDEERSDDGSCVPKVTILSCSGVSDALYDTQVVQCTVAGHPSKTVETLRCSRIKHRNVYNPRFPEVIDCTLSDNSYRDQQQDEGQEEWVQPRSSRHRGSDTNRLTQFFQDSLSWMGFPSLFAKLIAPVITFIVCALVLVFGIFRLLSFFITVLRRLHRPRSFRKLGE